MVSVNLIPIPRETNVVDDKLAQYALAFLPGLGSPPSIRNPILFLVGSFSCNKSEPNSCYGVVERHDQAETLVSVFFPSGY